MDKIRVIDDYCEMLCKELQKIVDSGKIEPSGLEIGNMISETFKDFEKYKMMKYAEENPGEYPDGYYREGGYNNYGRYPDYMYQDGGNSSSSTYNRGYNNGSGSNMNNGSRNYGGYGTYNNSRGGNYRNYGHEPAELNMMKINELEHVMNEMPEGQGKEQIRQRIEQLRHQSA